jgi:3-deoxy-7-phosphoheptulonate synthase
MRVYIEKQRTSLGWKGLVYDPFLDNSFRMNEGLWMARDLLLEINAMGIPAATEFLNPVTEKYIGDLISWGSIGTRTVTSQLHRELASGVGCPVGFKNGLSGDIKVAADAIFSARRPHCYISTDEWGMAAALRSEGNPDCHLVLRGGTQPNYATESVEEAAQLLSARGLPDKIMVDCSHANCRSSYADQVLVAEEVVRQIKAGSQHILGVMIESNLIGGRQDLTVSRPLTFGQSITDACLGLEETARIIEMLAATTPHSLRQKSRPAPSRAVHSSASAPEPIGTTRIPDRRTRSL